MPAKKAKKPTRINWKDRFLLVASENQKLREQLECAKAANKIIADEKQRLEVRLQESEQQVQKEINLRDKFSALTRDLEKRNGEPGKERDALRREVDRLSSQFVRRFLRRFSRTTKSQSNQKPEIVHCGSGGTL